MNAKQLLGGMILLGLAAACSEDGSTPDAGTGGSGGTSTTGLAGAGGEMIATGGAPGTGGAASTGGKTGSTGGKSGTGGKSSSGGTSGDGGSNPSGGTSGDGGSLATGGDNGGGTCASGKKLVGKVVINEIWALSNNQQAPYDFIELYNVSGGCVDLTGVYFHDIFPVTGTKATIGSTELGAGKYLVLTKGTEFPFGLSNGGDGVALFAPDGTLIDSTEWEHPDADVSWGRSPNGTGSFAVLTEATPGASNASPATK